MYEVISQATIVFEDVYSHLFHDPDSIKNKTTPYLSERIELTSIEYHPNDIRFKTISRYAPNTANLNVKGDFNIFIELWNASLFIKAGKPNINDEVFELSQPPHQKRAYFCKPLLAHAEATGH